MTDGTAAGSTAKLGTGEQGQASSEHRELVELYDLFGGARVSSVPVGLYVKFEVSQENREKAAQARLERSARDKVREEVETLKAGIEAAIAADT